jgi:hypothetical protein
MAKQTSTSGASEVTELPGGEDQSANAPFIRLGTAKSEIPVRISYRIIDLFSKGLYNSPSKAVEELVSNSFDAGATKVHVIISPDLVPSSSTIAVIDNGSGMDEAGLQQHWLIGVSNKRSAVASTASGRSPIGKFGIGKLATYVLAEHLTHVTKFAGKYYAATMNYSEIPDGENGGLYTEKVVSLPLRHLTKAQAEAILKPWTEGSKPAFKELVLFGDDAAPTWTVAIMSTLKDMAREMQRGRLRWILSTAMPLRDDFKLYLDGDLVKPSKSNIEKFESWTLGKDITDLPSPASSELQVTEDATEDKKSTTRWGLTHPTLGRVTGYAELYKELLTTGKSADTGHSNGFFVYVRGRLVNTDDEYFGIDSNLLRHGTFARFRMVVNIDRLDVELRSSRESVRAGPLVEIAKNILIGVFKVVRAAHEKIEVSEAPGVQTARRLASTPGSLTRRPLIGLVSAAFEGTHSPRYTSYPKTLSKPEQVAFLETLETAGDGPDGLIKEVKLVDDLSQGQGIAVFDASAGILQINLLHPFVAHFLDEYNHKAKNVPLELIAMSEVLLEAHLFELGLSQDIVDDALSRRDELLRTLSRSSGSRNALHIAQALVDAGNNKAALEVELTASFESLGFSDAVKIGGQGNPDGYAEARLGANAKGAPQAYKVTLEAKSKEQIGAKVSAKTVGIAGIARHRKDKGADFAIVAGPDFPTTAGEKSALAKEIADDRAANKGKGITLIRLVDLARLVRLVPAKRIGLHRLRELFETCSLPDECKEWVDNIAAEKATIPPYRELLEAIAAEMKDLPNQAIEYSNVVTQLRLKQNIRLSKSEVVELCQALSKMATGYVFSRSSTVEITQRPDRILSAISSTIKEYPEDEQKKIAVAK